MNYGSPPSYRLDFSLCCTVAISHLLPQPPLALKKRAAKDGFAGKRHLHNSSCVTMSNHQSLEEKTLSVILDKLSRIEAISEEKQDESSNLIVGSSLGDPDYVFESDLHYGTYAGLRYG